MISLMRKTFSSLVLICLLYFPLAAQQSTATALDALFDKFYAASSAVEMQAVEKEILVLHPSFDDVYQRLQKGRTYSEKVTRGFMEWHSYAPPSIKMYCLIFIPLDYTPSKKYPVRVFLHGAVSNTDPRFVDTWINRNDTTYNHVQEIQVYPSANLFSPWWSDRQYNHIMQTLWRLKSIYNVDENNIKLGGASDGGTGTYFYANADPTTWSSFTPFIGNSAALDVLSKRQTYLSNFSSKPFFIINGARDEVFDIRLVKAYADALMQLNRNSSFIVVDTSGHNLNWLGVLHDTLEHFIALHSRNPLPDTIEWMTDRTDLFNRNHWVIIEKTGKTKYDAALEDPNTVILEGASRRAFHRDTLTGIIKVMRSDNTIEVQTKNVKTFRLLLSPAQFDFSKPVKIITDGIVSYDAMVSKDISTLFEWYIRDLDRTMLFGASLDISVGKKSKE
jgi:hypothetical protein